MTRAADVMTRDLTTIPMGALLEEAAQLLQRFAIRHLPVVDETGELVGMLSDRDVARAPARIEDPGASGRPRPTLVADVITSDLSFATADDDLNAIARMMIDRRIGAVPIVDDHGYPIGVISYVDALRVLIGDDEAAETDEPIDVTSIPPGTELPRPTAPNHGGHPIGHAFPPSGRRGGAA